MISRALLFIFAWTVSGCYDNAGTPPPSDGSALLPNLSIADLVVQCGDHPYRIVQDIVIAGCVTSTDKSGNFYRSVILQDGEAAVELMAGLSDLYRIYPPGYRVSIQLRGLAICRRYGVVQVGQMPSAGDYAVEYIGSRALLDHSVERGPIGVPPEPRTLSIPALTPDRCGTLVRIENLTLMPPEEDSTERSWKGYRQFTDTEGNTITTYTSDFARYADAEIPIGAVSLMGILQYGNAGATGKSYMIKMRDENDCLR